MAIPLVVFASGTKIGGGSGFENLANKLQNGKIVLVVSNHEKGGVHERAGRLKIPFYHFSAPWSGKRVEEIIKSYDDVYVTLSGWLKHVPMRRLGFWPGFLRLFGLNRGLDPHKTFNIHPGPLSVLGGRFGGKGMYGDHVHKAVAEALERGEITTSAVTMHFVINGYDRGPIFFEKPVSLQRGMSWEEIKKLVLAEEHTWQPIITDLVVLGQIFWDGKNPATLSVPTNYEYLPKRGQ